METLTPYIIEQKISQLEDQYAEQFERHARTEKLNKIWQQIKALKHLQKLNSSYEAGEVHGFQL